MNSAEMRHRQTGVAILAVTIILLLIATIATLMVGRTSLMEQKIVGIDVRSKEVYSAATSGLEFGVNWISTVGNAVLLDGEWSCPAGADCGCGKNEVADMPSLPVNSVLNSDTYTHEISYTRINCEDDPQQIIEIASLASAVSDSHIEKTVRTEIFLARISLFSGASNIFDGPPLLVEGCILEGGPNGVTGNPDIYPSITPNGDLVAIGTTTGNIDCLLHGNFDLHDGEKAALLPSASMWNSVFGPTITKADLKAQASSPLNNPERIIFVDNSYPQTNGWNGNNWHRSVGTDDAPVLLFFDASQGCPKLNGSVNIVGIVYFEAADCSDHGWGGGTIKGTVAVSGDLKKFNANTEIIGVDLSDFLGGGNDTNDVFFVYVINAIPGSWRDF